MFCSYHPLGPWDENISCLLDFYSACLSPVLKPQGQRLLEPHQLEKGPSLKKGQLIPKKTSVFSGRSLIGLVSCSFSGGLSGR